MNVSIRQLQGFILVARLGSFTRAAERLHITQAGLSSMIRDLESQFDCRLFDRTTRSVSLTPAGESLIQSAEQVVRELQRAKAQVRANSVQENRLLKVAVTHVVAASLMPHIITAFRPIEPSVEIRVLDVAQGEIQPMVEKGEADIGFSIYRKPSTSTETRELIRFPLVYIAPRGSISFSHDGNRKLPTIGWDEIPDIALISLSPELPLQQSIDAALTLTQRNFEAGAICNSMQTIISMVSAGHGAALLPSVIVPLCEGRRIDIGRLSDDSVMQPYWQVWKRGRRLPNIVAPFIRTFKSVAMELCLV